MRCLVPILALPLLLAACGQRFSPDAYATRAVQQMNRVEQGVVIGRRAVAVQADGTTGATSGAAAGGIIGAQSPGGDMTRAIGGVGGALVGGLFGAATERVAGDTTATEYIVRKANGELVSVTQRDATPLDLGQRVLVIGGAQARIVPDYTQPVPGESALASPPATSRAPEPTPTQDPAPPPFTPAVTPIWTAPLAPPAAPAVPPLAAPEAPLPGG
jgi:outer membrane lipoprotein SlyB